MRQGLVFIAVFLAMTLFIGVAGSAMADSRAAEYRLKAAFLLNFARFATWPEGSFTQKDSPIVIGVLGRNPFGGSLQQLEGKQAGGRRVEIHQLATMESVLKCHLLYVSTSETLVLNELIRQIETAPILLVSDIPRFAERGGHIHLYTRRNKVRFRINVDALEPSGVVLSSKLLRLAELVEGVR